MLALLLFFPLAFFALFIYVSPEMLMNSYTLGPIFGYSFTSSLLQLFCLAFIAYMILLYVYIMGGKVSRQNKIESLEREIVLLKSELYNEQAHLLDKLTGDIADRITSLEKSNDAKFERIIKFNEYTLDKVVAATQSDFDKYKKETYKILQEADIKDKTLMEKLKVWE